MNRVASDVACAACDQYGHVSDLSFGGCLQKPLYKSGYLEIFQARQVAVVLNAGYTVGERA
jgi:hypothetical protein